jgi:hypothetical protein
MLLDGLSLPSKLKRKIAHKLLPPTLSVSSSYIFSEEMKGEEIFNPLDFVFRTT